MATQAVGPTSLAAANATSELRYGTPMDNHTVIVQGTFTGLTLVLEGSADGVTWFGLKLTQASTAGTVASDVVSAVGIYSTTSIVPLSMVRARATAITTGAALVSLVGSD